ncbi:beta-galactosidase [Cohnella nanjingensis]|uniref:Beta-galactosidase n=1 Tax=Cohnella nanjingensis TaxID=1387779 RepID=A0A7X0RM15_9BACL|nr:carbohydrate binding domain-containing protein [Cohnella nanjingensis]MBB6670017.1 beta-galactosidase [Cohnella nanjingensis]
MHLQTRQGGGGRWNRFVAFALAGFLAFGLIVPAGGADVKAQTPVDETIVVEGEQAVSHNFTGWGSGTIVDPAYSGGAYFRLLTDDAAPAGGYVASYEVNAPVSGVYELGIIATPADEIWTSPYAVRINDGNFVSVVGAREIGRVNDTVRKYTAGLIELREGVNTVSFKVDERRKLGDNHYVLFLDAFSFRKVPLGIHRIRTDAPMNVYEDKDNVKLTVELTESVAAAASVSVEVKDYRGQVLYSGQATVPAKQREAEIPLGTLARGHYTVEVRLANSASAITTYFSVVVPYDQRKMPQSSPFAIDAAFSYLVKPGDIPDFAEAMKRIGVQWVRDRIVWSVVNPAPGVFDYSHYDPLIQAVANKGIKILDVYADAPTWTQSKAGDKLPTDLLATYRYAKDSADHFGSTVQAWEIWNEEEAAFTSQSESADQFAAFLKAAAIGYRDSVAKPLTAVGGLAFRPGDYAQLLMDNQMLKYIDIYNVHSYPKGYAPDDPDIVPFPDHAANHYRFLLANGGAKKQLWVTEAGIPISANGAADMTLREQRAQARYLVTSAVESLSVGVDKHFWFVMPYYKEGTSQYGMFNAENAPYPAYAAEANMTDVLGEAKYARAQANLPSGAQGHWFRNGNRSVLVLWSEQPQSIRLDLHADQVDLVDMMGRKQTIQADRHVLTVQAGPDPMYVVTGNPSDAEAGVPHNGGNNGKAQTKLTQAERIVLNQKYADSARENMKAFGAYKLETETPNRVELEVYNLNDSPVTGKVKGEATGGWKMSPAEQLVSLDPFERKVLSFEVTAGPQTKRNAIADVTFTGTIGGKPTSPTVARITTELTGVQVDPIPGADDPARWIPNISPGGVSHISAGAEAGSVQFKYEFVDAVKWTYPILEFPAGTNYSGKDGIAFMVYSENGVPDTELRLMVDEMNGSTYYTINAFAIKPGWNQVIVPFGSLVWANFGGQDDNGQLDLDRLKGIKLGINTSLNDVPAFAVKDVGTYTVPRQ